MKRMIIAGGSGFLGNCLAGHFRKLNYEVGVLTRGKINSAPQSARSVRWDAATLGPWADELDGADAVVNLTGRSVDCRYHARNRREIMQSRLESTKAIASAIARCQSPPRVWLNSSTATIYQHTLTEAWDENGPIAATPEAKDEFSIQVAQAWEDALNQAQTPATRKIALRTAMVLGYARNSVFPVLRRLVRMGLGGKMGTGQQFVSWIHQLDFCRAIEWLLSHDSITGTVNICAPHPLRNAEMMHALRKLYHMPFGLPAPRPLLEFGAFFLRTETELILKSRSVVPTRLLASGFDFRFPYFEQAIENLASAEPQSP